jgi:hypothetical protein
MATILPGKEKGSLGRVDAEALPATYLALWHSSSRVSHSAVTPGSARTVITVPTRSDQCPIRAPPSPLLYSGSTVSIAVPSSSGTMGVSSAFDAQRVRTSSAASSAGLLTGLENSSHPTLEAMQRTAAAAPHRHAVARSATAERRPGFMILSTSAAGHEDERELVEKK